MSIYNSFMKLIVALFLGRYLPMEPRQNVYNLVMTNIALLGCWSPEMDWPSSKQFQEIRGATMPGIVSAIHILGKRLGQLFLVGIYFTLHLSQIQQKWNYILMKSCLLCHWISMNNSIAIFTHSKPSHMQLYSKDW